MTRRSGKHWAISDYRAEVATDPVRIRENRIISRALGIVERRARAPGASHYDQGFASLLFFLSLTRENREHFEAAFMDEQYRLISRERLFSGTINYATVHVRIVAQRALVHNAAAVIVAHNHPSGNPKPSAEDKAITALLRVALNMVDVRLVDHLIVGDRAVYSMVTRKKV